MKPIDNDLPAPEHYKKQGYHVTNLCEFYIKGGCFNDNCMFAHGKSKMEAFFTANRCLDMFMAIASIGLGYRHPVMLNKAKDEIVQQQIITRSGVGVHPETHYIDICNRAFIDVAPKGLNRV